MNRPLMLGTLALLPWLVTRQESPSLPPEGWTTRAVVHRVIDGDTFEADVRIRVTVRMLDCWAPDIRTRNMEEKRRALDSKAYLERLIDQTNSEVILHVPSHRRLADSFSFGRLLGYVWLSDDDLSLSERMIRSGHASKNRPK